MRDGTWACYWTFRGKDLHSTAPLLLLKEYLHCDWLGSWLTRDNTCQEKRSGETREDLIHTLPPSSVYFSEIIKGRKHRETLLSCLLGDFCFLLLGVGYTLAIQSQ